MKSSCPPGGRFSPSNRYMEISHELRNLKVAATRPNVQFGTGGLKLLNLGIINPIIKPMKTILLFVIILSITGCLSMNPQDPGTSTTVTKKQVKYMWSQLDKDMTKKEVAHILGNPTDVRDSEDIETWKYEYDIARTYGIVGFHRNDNLVRFFSKPSF